ncbi:MAG TPA: prolyl oligopeptidase family serine peptidase [Myxococcales bacterium]|nr:prolyl oligopeptidase family serine peptidase [Myxococcales bacterium]
MNRTLAAALLALAALVAACTTTGSTKPTPPPAAPDAGTAKPPVVLPQSRKEEVVDTINGQQVADPFRWLENDKAQEVKDWIKAEDEFARHTLVRLRGRKELDKRLSELLYVESASPPVKRAGRLFYLKQLADKEKAVLFMREGANPEKVVLDPNKWSRDGSIALGTWTPSWDGRWVVFQFKPNNSDEATLKVASADNGGWTKKDIIDGGKYASPSWSADSAGFYYEWVPPLSAEVTVADRPGFTEIRYHRLNTEPAQDEVVHPKLGDPTTFLNQHISADGKYLFVNRNHGWAENDVYVRHLAKDKDFKLMVQGKNATYQADELGDQLYILTDEGAPHRRVFRTPAAKPERKAWKPLVAEDKEAVLETMDLVGGQLALSYLVKAHSELRFASADGKGKARPVALPGVGVVTQVTGLPDDDEAYFQYSSFTAPKEVLKLSAKTLQTEEWAKTLEPIDPAAYSVEQVSYPSRDGTQISMFVVTRKDFVKDGSRPALLYGYGGFNLPMLPAFNPIIFPWLDAGGAYALPQLRGGGEYGKGWHDAGRGKNKQNVFDDFAAAAEYLVKEKYTQPAKLAIMGGSNGGLLAGAAVTQHPELFGAVVCRVPLLDMVRYTQFGSGKTWIHEYGDPANPEDFKVLYAYSPYHHLDPAKKYPPVLMLSSDQDDRVDPLHARKFVAALQSSGQPALLRVESNAGHGGADLLKKTVDVHADMYAWLFHTLGMQPPAPSPGGQKPAAAPPAAPPTSGAK